MSPQFSGNGLGNRGLDRRGVPYEPRPAWIRTDPEGRPIRVNNRPVEQIAEEWLVSDRWWTPRPLRRHYFELVLATGACVTVYRDAISGRWFTQRA